MEGAFVFRNSVNSYGRMDPRVQERQRKAHFKRWLTILVSSLILTAATMCLVFGLIRIHKSSPAADASDSGFPYGFKAIQAACNSTLYPQVCQRDLLSDPGSLSANPRQLVVIAVRVALARVHDALTHAKNISATQGSAMENSALRDCIELLDDSTDQLNSSISQLSNLSLNSLREQFANVKVQVSTSHSYISACEDGFFNEKGNISKVMMKIQQAVSESVANALYLVNALSKLGKYRPTWKEFFPSIHFQHHLSNHILKDVSLHTELPGWITPAARRLLQAPTSSLTYNAVVAKDGSGRYQTIQQAVDEAPRNSNEHYVIFIKAGTYSENVELSKNVWNIMFLGEGTDKTIITNDRNVALRNYTTFRSATVAVSGRGFIAKDITFQNSAGPSGHQAVAVRVSADMMVFQNCNMEGYQDTLYALSSRQFYTGCKIYGTIDFIFGNAAAVFQGCELVARLPMQNQQNTYTAQGRKLAGDDTGFTFQNCTVKGADDLKNSSNQVNTYLGRPWKDFSRTIFVESYLDDLINPAGWLSWNQSNPFITTVYYGEYANTGPGSSTASRVKWPGVHSNLTANETEGMSVASLFVDVSWLVAANVVFREHI